MMAAKSITEPIKATTADAMMYAKGLSQQAKSALVEEKGAKSIILAPPLGRKAKDKQRECHNSDAEVGHIGNKLVDLSNARFSPDYHVQVTMRTYLM